MSDLDVTNILDQSESIAEAKSIKEAQRVRRRSFIRKQLIPVAIAIVLGIGVGLLIGGLTQPSKQPEPLTVSAVVETPMPPTKVADDVKDDQIAALTTSLSNLEAHTDTESSTQVKAIGMSSKLATVSKNALPLVKELASLPATMTAGDEQAAVASTQKYFVSEEVAKVNISSIAKKKMSPEKDVGSKVAMTGQLVPSYMTSFAQGANDACDVYLLQGILISDKKTYTVSYVVAMNDNNQIRAISYAGLAGGNTIAKTSEASDTVAKIITASSTTK